MTDFPMIDYTSDSENDCVQPEAAAGRLPGMDANSMIEQNLHREIAFPFPCIGPPVLLVDDSPAVTHALARILESKGYRAIPFLAAIEAMEWLDRNHRIDPPAIVVLDIHMPDGSGLQIARRARELLGDAVPVLILSGDTSIDLLRELPESGATLFLAKPVHVPSLLAKLQKWSDAAGARAVEAKVVACENRGD